MSDIWRICVVEGDVFLNQNLVHALREDGHVVEGVTNSTDAIRVLGSEEYKVVICDQNLSGGFELLRWLRSYRSNVRVIVLGDADKAGECSQHLEAFKTGTISYVQKPIDLRLLKDELHRLLRQTGFTASLDSFDLLDVMQIVAMSRKSITLLVDTGLEGRGILRFQNGDLAWAEYGVLRGEDAFLALTAHKHGTVTQQLSDEPLASNVTQPLSRLIFQALQYRTKDAHTQQASEQGLVGTDLAPVLPAENISPSAPSLPDAVDDSPFVFTSEAVVSDEPSSPQPMPQVAPATPVFSVSQEPFPLILGSEAMVSSELGPTQPMPQIASAAPAFSVPQEPFPPTAQFAPPVIEQSDFSQPDQYGDLPSPPAEDRAVNRYKGTKRGIIVGSVVTLIFLAFAIGTYATGTKTVTERPTPPIKAQVYQKNPTSPAQSPMPVVTSTPTPVPQSQPTPVLTSTPTPVPQSQPTPPVGVNGNPWGYDFNPGNLIYDPPGNFCDYFNCINNFWSNSNGYVGECSDGIYSHAGGAPNACVKHGREMRPLYAH